MKSNKALGPSSQLLKGPYHADQYRRRPRPVEDYARDAVPDPIKERENELVDSNQVARSVVSGSANALGESKDDKAADDKKISVVTAASGSSTTAEVTPTVTTVTPTTTTTKGPTHNSDGENIEKVKSEDVKIYQAPLVAAFTVQQDQLGVPRNVIPLLQSLPKKNPVDFKQSTPMVSTSHPVAQIQPVQNPPQAPATVPTPIPLNTQALEEKTRILEQQLVTLQTQQRIQEQLLRSKILQEQQLILQQQQQLQQERARLEEETRRRLQRRVLGISTLEIIRANTFIGEGVDIDGSTFQSLEVTPARPSSQCIPELPKNKIAALKERIQEVLIAKAGAGARFTEGKTRGFTLALAQSHLLLIAAAAGQEQSREEP
ncbi:conserved hypothetical protein [Culex quinquefasciatus]|uniref:Uncharacterized protein n=1 Tax=Culex quinquefasciatus TaxID=7176 RepID=B0WM94_CULQU|nr:conserved hypothetical protein [Culex quinquefasciatus]|eukprot:XP_001849828.1 conserved hypothetical protein [Culex quinquefasciatus]